MHPMLKIQKKGRRQLIHHCMLIIPNLIPTILNLRRKIPTQKARHTSHPQPTKPSRMQDLSPPPATTSCIIVIRCKSRISLSRNKSAVTMVRASSERDRYLMKKILILLCPMLTTKRRN